MGAYYIATVFETGTPGNNIGIVWCGGLRECQNIHKVKINLGRQNLALGHCGQHKSCKIMKNSWRARLMRDNEPGRLILAHEPVIGEML